MGTIKKFARYYKPHLKLFIIDLICAFGVAACNLVYPKVAGKMIETANLNYVLLFSAILLGIFTLKAFLLYVVTYWGHVVGVRIQGDMRDELFRHLQKLPFSYYDETKTGSIMSRLINDLFEVSELAHHGPEDLFLSVITIIGTLIMVGLINPWLAVIFIIIIPIIIVIAVKLRLSLMEAFKRSREKTSEINAAVESAVSGIRVSKAYNAEAHENQKFANANEELKKARSWQYKSMSNFMVVMNYAMDILYLCAFLAGGIFYANSLISASDLTTYVLYVAMLIAPIRTFTAIFEQIQEGMTGFERFLEVMEVMPEEEPANPVKVGKLKGNIEFDNVSFRYKKETDDEKHLILNGLSLKIDAGKTVALVGPSGGGKTTLCNLIPRFYDIDEGKITIDDINIRDMRIYDLRKNIGIVAQDVFIFGGTVKENIAYGDFDATDEQIIAAAKLANIHDFITTLDKGYDTYVGERGVKLSGGQKQRISIARAFLKNPPILILDEATSALDNVTEMQIQTALEKLSEGRTTLVVAHRLSTVKNADEIIVLSSDGIAERGTHAELMAKNGVYATLYNYQFRSL
ncbi:MAG: ABC transporter ATP-binding protein [Clostridia bacterium]|nr:ABC transporter ATP-binding protein [Clostridia bacterium]MDY2713866.1 ABC transporter ATP-binding protein [Christensenellaceae bacterium]